MDLESIREMKQEHLSQLMHKPNVVACGIGFKETAGEVTDELCLIVSVRRKLPTAELAPADLVPQRVGDIRTDVQQIGVVRAWQTPTDRWRPSPGGVSIGHVDITAGTLGCLVYRGQDLLILSNNHVLADCNRGHAGDAVLQPGPQDGGTLSDQIATLEDFVPIDFGQAPSTCGVANAITAGFNALARAFGSAHRISAFQQTPGTNAVDAALARPVSAALVEKRILNIGQPHGVGTATLNTKVVKSGRSTGFTTGQITQVDVTVQVEYPGVGTATFSDQLVAGGMSQPGDSGAAVLDIDANVVGLLFAGSDSTTMITPIQNVLSALNITIAL